MNREKIKSILKWTVIIGMILFGLNLVADNPYTQKIARSALNEKLSTKTNVKIDYKAFKITAIPPGIDLFGVNVYAEDNLQTPLFSADHLRGRLSLKSLVLGKAKIGSLEVSGLDIHLPFPWTFPGFLKSTTNKSDEPAQWPPNLDLPVERVILRNARLRIDLPLDQKTPLVSKPFTVNAAGIDLDLELSGDSADLKVTSQATDVINAGTSLLEQGSIDIVANLYDRDITISRIKIHGQRIKLDGAAVTKVRTEKRTKGTVLKIKENYDAPIGLDATGEFHADGDLSLLGSFLDIPNTKGEALADVKLKLEIPFDINPPRFEITGHANVKDGAIGGIRLFDVGTGLLIDDKHIAFSNIDVSVAGKPAISGNGSIQFNPSTTFDFKANTKNITLRNLLSAFNTDFTVLDFAIDSPDAHVWGTGIPFSLQATATALAKDFDLLNDQNRSRFPRSPSCLASASLHVDEKAISFKEITGNCFAMKNESSPPFPKPGETIPPVDSFGQSPMRFSGFINQDQKGNVNLRADLPSLSLDLGTYFAQFPTSGRGSVSANISGDKTKTIVSVNAQVEELVLNGAKIGTVQTEFDIDENTIRWQRLQIEPGDGGNISSPSGSLIIGKDLSFEANVDSANLKKKFIGGLFNLLDPTTEVSFDVNEFKGKLSGPLLKPLAYHWDAQFQVSNGAVGDQYLFDSFRTEVKSNQSFFQTRGAQWVIGNTMFTPRLTIERPDNATKSTDDIWAQLGVSHQDKISIEISTPEDQPFKTSQNQIEKIPFIGSLFSTAGIKGTLAIDGKLVGTIDSMQGAFQGRIDSMVLWEAPIAPLTFKGFVQGSQLDLVANQAGTALDARMNIDLGNKKLPYDWFISLRRYDLRAMMSKYFYDDPRNFAYIDGSWQMKGELTDWWGSTGTLAINSFKMKYFRELAGTARHVELALDKPVIAELAQGGWNFKDPAGLLISGKSLRLHLSTINNRPPQHLGLKLDSMFDVDLMKFISSSIESATGKLFVNADLKGSVTNPELSLNAGDVQPSPMLASTWEPLSIGLVDFRPPLKNISFKANAKNGQLVLEDFAADKGGGSINASGTFNLYGDVKSEESNIEITLDEAAVIYPVAVFKSFDTDLNGTLVLSGHRPPYRLRGDINVVRARSNRDFDLRSEIVNTLRKRSFASERVKENTLLDIDISLNADNSININNRNMQVVLSSNLQITGTDAQPSLTGQVEVNRGKFAYKRDFKVTRGILTFDNPIRPDPNLDILAVSEVSTYRVYIAVTGRASNPQVDFLVDPPTRDDGTPITKVDAILLLSRGTLPDSKRSLDETENAVSSEALNILVGQFEEPVEKLFDLSGQRVIRQVYLDTYPSQETGAPVPRLNLPISFSDALNLQRELGFVLSIDRDKFWRVSSEYALHDGISLTGSVDRQTSADFTTGQSGAQYTDAGFDLKFRFAFP